MLAFESGNVRKVGGLGEAVYGLSRELANLGVDVSVIMPSHGTSRSDVLDEIKTGKLAIQELCLDKVRFFLVKGIGEDSQDLNSPIVYGEGITEVKAALMAREAASIANVLTRKVGAPDIVHLHDWHSVPLGMAFKKYFDDRNHEARFLFHVHMFVSKRVSWSYLFEECGLVPNHRTKAFTGTSWLTISYGEAYRKGGGVLEKIGALVFDWLVTVSRSYLEMDENCLLRVLGDELAPKSGYIHNGTGWRYEEILSSVLSLHGESINMSQSIGRRELRRYLLTKALGSIPSDQPIITDTYLESIVRRLETPLLSVEGRPRPFDEDGPLIISTGRVSYQKGLDILLKALPVTLRYVPEAKLLMMLLPVREEEHLMGLLAGEASKYPNNVRIVYGETPYIYHLAHIAADVFAAPSRWEPFGIMAIEAMSVGVPVVGSDVGGLREIIVDLREDPEKGVGLLVPKENPEELGNALAAMLTIMNPEPKYLEKLRTIDPSLAKVATKLTGEEIRERCIKRVDENFRWDKSARKALETYHRLAELTTHL